MQVNKAHQHTFMQEYLRLDEQKPVPLVPEQVQTCAVKNTTQDIPATLKQMPQAEQ